MSQQKPYDLVLPFATYAPWLTDKEFNEIALPSYSQTLLDVYRLYELWQLVAQAAKLPTGALIEIGVWQGGSGAVIAKQALLNNLSDPVYLCDTFTGVVKASTKDNAYSGGEHADTSLQQVETLISKQQLNNVKILQGIFPEETAAQIKETSFRFCHIDVDVYQSAKDILDWLWERLVPGGICVFDDYGFEHCNGITELVNDQRKLPGRTVIHNLNGHAIIIKTP